MRRVYHWTQNHLIVTRITEQVMLTNHSFLLHKFLYSQGGLEEGYDCYNPCSIMSAGLNSIVLDTLSSKLIRVRIFLQV